MGDTATIRRTRLRVLVGFTVLFALASAMSFGWWRYQLNKARNELSEAAQSGAWDRYQAAIRNEWPALEWFIASVVFLFLAVSVGAVTLLCWTTAKRKAKSPPVIS